MTKEQSPICPICKRPYPKDRDGYNRHTGTPQHRKALDKATGR